MKPKLIVPGVYELTIGGFVNAFLLAGDELTLIDTGTPSHADELLAAVRTLGHPPAAIKHLLVTHCHPDHSGSLAALQRATGAPTYMHALDAALVRQGQGRRPLAPTPGLMKPLMGLMTGFMNNPRAGGIEPAPIAHEVADGDLLPIAGGLRVLHVPGHSAGQVAFLWPQQGGVLFAADAASHLLGRLGPPPVCEDWPLVQSSLRRLAALDFAVAVFGHGGAIVGDAAAQFRAKWGSH